MGKTPEMVERVGQALGAPLEDWAHGKVTTADLSRTAIQAMRVATKEMLYAGNDGIDADIDSWNYDSGHGYSVEPQAAYNVWQRMIDAALAAPDEGEGP